MIKPDDRLTIQTIALDCIQIKEYQTRYFERLEHYINLLKLFPNDYPGCLFVTPSDTHAGMYALLDGHTRYCAMVMCGRSDALCVIVEDAEQQIPEWLKDEALRQREGDS